MVDVQPTDEGDVGSLQLFEIFAEDLCILETTIQEVFESTNKYDGIQAYQCLNQSQFTTTTLTTALGPNLNNSNNESIY